MCSVLPPSGSLHHPLLAQLPSLFEHGRFRQTPSQEDIARIRPLNAATIYMTFIGGLVRAYWEWHSIERAPEHQPQRTLLIDHRQCRGQVLERLLCAAATILSHDLDALGRC